MRFFSLRNRTTLRRILLVLLILVLALVAIGIGLFFYLQRYLVYTQDGVHLDFSRPRIEEPDKSPTDAPGYDFSTLPIEEVEAVVPGIDVSSMVLSGYSVPHALLHDPDRLLSILDNLESDGPVALLIDVKDAVGNLFYSSAVEGQGPQSGDLLSDLVPTLKRKGYYLIARVSAFRDRSFGLSHTNSGLPLSSGALWMDSGGCYWLDPADSAVQIRLVRICNELYALGFHEVVLGNFYFPSSDAIVYSAPDGTDAVVAASAAAISDALTGAGEVSFQLEEGQPLFSPGSGRLFIQAESAAALPGITAQAESLLENQSVQLVFLTDSRDTRFEGYGLLRPLDEN